MGVVEGALHSLEDPGLASLLLLPRLSVFSPSCAFFVLLVQPVLLRLVLLSLPPTSELAFCIWRYF